MSTIDDKSIGPISPKPNRIESATKNETASPTVSRTTDENQFVQLINLIKNAADEVNTENQVREIKERIQNNTYVIDFDQLSASLLDDFSLSEMTA